MIKTMETIGKKTKGRGRVIDFSLDNPVENQKKDFKLLESIIDHEFLKEVLDYYSENKLNKYEYEDMLKLYMQHGLDTSKLIANKRYL